MAGLKQLYKKRKDLLNKQALAATNLKRMQEEMELHAPYLHQMTYDLMPEDVKAQFEAMGRKGDTEIRNIDGKPAHVTPGEASLYDSLGKSAIPAIKERGAGTINPKTGLKEYHNNHEDVVDGHRHTTYQNPYGGTKIVTHTSQSSGGVDYGTTDYQYGQGKWNTEAQDWEQELWGGNVTYGGARGDQAEDELWAAMGYGTGEISWDEMAGYSDAEMAGYLDTQWDIGMDKMPYIGKLDTQKIADMEESWAMKEDALSKTGRAQVRKTMSQAEKLQAKSGGIRAGAIGIALEKQKRDLIDSLTADIRMSRLDRDMDISSEKTTQMDKIYDEIGDFT